MYKKFKNSVFLVMNTTYHPTGKVKTHIKGWQDLPGSITLQEHPQIVDRVSMKMMTEAQLIIDVKTSTMIKNRFTKLSDETVVEAYMKKYEDIISRGLKQYELNHAEG